MTVLDRFVEFARALPDEDRHSLEDVLDAIMHSGLTNEQLGVLDQRMGEENPEYATDEEVADFGLMLYRTRLTNNPLSRFSVAKFGSDCTSSDNRENP